MSASSSAQGLSYLPQPFEQAYYIGLFNAADSERQGSIGGPNAVAFFARSKLSIDILKSIWIAADNPPNNALDHRKFAVAVRLIQLAQNGQKAEGPSLDVAVGVNLRPAFFEGVSGVSLPLPQPGQRQTPQPMNPQQMQPQVQQQSQQPTTPTKQFKNPGTQSPSRQAVLNGMSVPQLSGAQSVSPPRQPNYQSSPGLPMIGTNKSVALTVQDPYTLTPMEQSRYEQLFVEYAKDDGYCYGQEAVGLFLKSGLPQPQLSAIWNMVDTPVDNRLDKLEFAIAMHLIVCVSKKNLPLPPALPLPLKQLKSQLPPMQPMMPHVTPVDDTHHQPESQASKDADRGNSHVDGVTMSSGWSGGQMNTAAIHGGMQGGSTYGTGNPSSYSVDVDLKPGASIAGGVSTFSGLPGPPPLQPSGGASISDAFEGLVAGGDTESVSTYRASSPPPMHISTTQVNAAGSSWSPKSTVNNVAAPSPPPSTFSEKKVSAVHYNTQSTGELEELRALLQKLQAENISLKAKLGTFSEEEDDVRKELKKTVTQITELSNQLTTSRAQVLAAKSRLLDLTGELSAAKEKKSVVTDLITETDATKIAIEQATLSVGKAAEASKTISSAQPPAPAFGGDLFDWGSGAVEGTSEPVPSTGNFASTTSTNTELNAATNSFPASDVAESTDMYSSGSYGQSNASKSFEHQQEHDNQKQSYSYNFAEPSADLMRKDLTREASLGFGQIMGGGSDLRSITSGSLDTYRNEEGGSESVEELKVKANEAKNSLREAESVSMDAEANLRQLEAHAEEMRKMADEADTLARDLHAKASGKKKGVFGRGQKTDIKEAEKAALDAQEKKDGFLQIQSQINDARDFASRSRKEAEKQRKRVEDLEIKAASAASMQKQAPASSPPATNGFLNQAPVYGFGTLPPTRRPSTNDTFGVVPNNHGQGFTSNVMGGGGISIPTPTGVDDPYGNPFG